MGIADLHNIIRTQIQPQIAENKKLIIESNKEQEQKLLQERVVLQERFEIGQSKSEGNFQVLEVDVKGKIEEYVRQIKDSFGEDLKQQMLVHRKNMINAVETKCFNIDKDLDMIKQHLAGAQLIVQEPEKVHKMDKLDFTSGEEED